MEDYQNNNEENKETKKSKLPIVFTILKIIGPILIIAAIVCFVISQNNFGNFENDNFMQFGLISSICFFVGFLCTAIGFLPNIQKMNIKMAKHIQTENKDDLKDLADTNADIMGDAVTKTAKNVKKGLKDTKFCKYCGSEIDTDSVYCNKCGKEQ